MITQSIHASYLVLFSNRRNFACKKLRIIGIVFRGLLTTNY